MWPLPSNWASVIHHELLVHVNPFLMERPLRLFRIGPCERIRCPGNKVIILGLDMKQGTRFRKLQHHTLYRVNTVSAILEVAFCKAPHTKVFVTFLCCVLLKGKSLFRGELVFGTNSETKMGT